MDLIHRIQIQRSGSTVARLTGIGRFDRGVDTIWTVDIRSDGSGLMQARQRWGAGGERRRRAAVRRRVGAGVLQYLRKVHQDVQMCAANTMVDPMGGEDGSTWRMARRRGSGTPARTTRRHGALRRELTAPK
jgi:hypothetical protein